MRLAFGGRTMSSMLRPTTLVRAAGEDAVVSCSLAGEAALLHLRRGAYYGLDTVGACVWEMLQQEKAVAQIHSALLARFEVEPERCERDLLALLAQMEEAGLILTREPA